MIVWSCSFCLLPSVCVGQPRRRCSTSTYSLSLGTSKPLCTMYFWLIYFNTSIWFITIRDNCVQLAICEVNKSPEDEPRLSSSST
eukprot:GSA120T00000270001.1